MRSRLLVLALLGAVLTGCNSGSSTSGLGAARCGPSGSSIFCLSSCNLGCSTNGCSITEIAQNQPIELVFSQAVAADSVNTGSVSLKTSNGEQPTGDWTVQGNRIVFIPSVRVFGGTTAFGFRAGETYILTLPSGGQSLRSTSGDRLTRPVSCALTVSRGIVDLDGQRPQSTLVSPTTTNDVSDDVTIIVKFSEIIDVGPFIGSNSATSPVLYRIRRTRVNSLGQRECDPDANPRVLEGVPRATVDLTNLTTTVTLKPGIKLPGQVCVEVEVTSRVRDLSGKPAIPVTYVFQTAKAPRIEKRITETFDSDALLDKARSSGTWSNGVAVPGPIGNDGIHGDFDITIGDSKGGGVFEFGTEDQVIPADRSLDQKPHTVTDGVFRFTNFRLKDSQTLIFRGSKIPRIYVRGNCQIDGRIEVNAPGIAVHGGNQPLGQAPGLAGIGGGLGGKGGDKCDGNGIQPKFQGQDGSPVQLLAGHAYGSRAAGTGGKGGVTFPVSGKNTDVTYKGLQNFFSAQVGSGGGGGGSFGPGGEGKAIRSVSNELGPPAPGGKAFDPFPIPNNADHLEHFMVGGSGGGGGGSNAFFSNKNNPTPTWHSGAAGTGGGGVLALIVGRNFSMGGEARLECRGGLGARAGAQELPSPGGGGSGGSVVVQVAGLTVMSGRIDVSGGNGSLVDDRSIFSVETRGGDGSPGWIRMEVTGNVSKDRLGTTIPPATDRNVGPLTAVGKVVGMLSLWRATRQVFPPEFLRYAIRAEIDGDKVVYSDDPAYKDDAWGPNRGLAGRGGALYFQIQGARVNSATGEPEPNTIKPWRDTVGFGGNPLDKDEATGFRFQLFFDRTTVKDIKVHEITVFFIG